MTYSKVRSLPALALLPFVCGGGGCGGGPKIVAPDGGIDFSHAIDLAPSAKTFRYVVNDIQLPQSQTDFAADLTGSGKAVNQFGTVVSSVKLTMIDLQKEENLTLAKGQGLNLFAFSTSDVSYQTDPRASLHLYLAQTQAPPDFTGAGTYQINGSVPASMLTGPVAGGQFQSLDPLQLATPPTVYLHIVLYDGIAVDMPVWGARMKFQPRLIGLMNGQLNGGMKRTDIDTILVPALATTLNLIAMQNPCQQNCQTVKSLFDTNGDGMISLAETKMNQLVKNLLAPDVQLFAADGSWKPNPANTNKDSVSLGVGFTAVKANFQEQ